MSRSSKSEIIGGSQSAEVERGIERYRVESRGARGEGRGSKGEGLLLVKGKLGVKGSSKCRSEQARAKGEPG